jgi:hypothetical protein
MSDVLALAAAYGVTIECVDLGDWGAATLVAEYDPRGSAIRVNARVFDRPNAGVANGALEHAIAHELYHHREAIGEIARLPERRARERAADAFAEACAGAR